MKKSHPLRRIVLAGAATVSGIVLLLSLKPASDPAAASADGAPQRQQQPAAPQGSGGAQAAGGTQVQTLTGDVVRTEYGNVQVRVTVAGGKITSAAAVQSPSGGRSTTVSADAVPKLNRAAVTAGTADIDAVSGATYTSGGYRKSLQSALDKAGAPGGGTADASGTGGGSGSGGGTGSGTGGGSGSGDASGSGAGAAQARTVTGEAVTTDYGPVQVRITVSDGKITGAEAVQQPEGGRSDQINGAAVPKLNAAAVAAGSADIDAVSGATYTSGGYKESLQSALDQAGG
ncbi:FMN-binding protein [Streptomyces beigongshangae]|uniref:FMN-binding protein n=1 Tax=Streptomyces beigongshangae TaxID=2841597 RepID=UPI001C84A5F9|nr:FMN-binding protein [Streptomyces sp. REN17]